MVSNFIAGFKQGMGCCATVANAVAGNDKEICNYYMRVDTITTSVISLSEKHVNHDFLRTQPPVADKTDEFWCDQNCKVGNLILLCFSRCNNLF